ncbi:MAG: 2-C-methyl-D-erythritol 4-phosphate cytidylyltransferase [Actinomycetota bacterium]|nr:2-C-methyl-D-erythritol 4-phosphate cytidylyltransferase [Actinomycetota bacterium]
MAAGGRGERTGGETPKQFRLLRGRPLLRWSIDMLTEAGCDPIVVVAPLQDMDQMRSLLLGEVDVAVVEGGGTRQESVANGLAHVTSDLVLVHDAARPFAPVDLARAVLKATEAAEGAVPAVPVDETIKRVEAGSVVETVDRSTLWRVQTPQAFRTAALADAHRRSRSEGFVATDDAQLIENYGGRVVVVRGTRTNIKLTYPEDFALAEAIAGGLE